LSDGEKKMKYSSRGSRLGEMRNAYSTAWETSTDLLSRRFKDANADHL
jgi:hypothetical protein